MRYKKTKILFLLVLLLAAVLLASSCGNSEKTAFIYMGDSQTDPDVGQYDYSRWQRLLQTALAQMDTQDRPLLVIGGDLVNNEEDEAEWSALFDAANNSSRIMPVPGNHTTGNDLYMGHFGLPQNGPEGFEGLFYSFDQGNIHFAMLDSNLLGSLDENVVANLQTWLDADLSQAKQPWKIIVMHHPMYPIGDNSKDQIRSQTMQQNYLSIMENHGVSLILCGHQHLYARTKPMEAGVVSASPQSGLIQLMGVSGNKYYASGDHDYIEFAASNLSVFSHISATKEKLTVKTMDLQANLIDQFEINK